MMNFFSTPTNPCPPKEDIKGYPEKLNKPVTVNINETTHTSTHRNNNVFGSPQNVENYNKCLNKIETNSPATYAEIQKQQENVATFAVSSDHPELAKDNAGGFWGKFNSTVDGLKQFTSNIFVAVESKAGAAYVAHEAMHEILSKSNLNHEASVEIAQAWDKSRVDNAKDSHREEYRTIYGGEPEKYCKEYLKAKNQESWDKFTHEIGAWLMSAKIKYGQEAIDKYASELAKVIDKHIGVKIFTESVLQIALEKCNALFSKFAARLDQPTPATENFKQLVQQKGLTESYKSSNPNNPIPAKGAKGDIGGVACSTEYIEGLFDSPEAIFEKDHYFCMPAQADGQIPFSDDELRQILRELAIGIYTHSTVPFFSLHFNQSAELVPIIHPVYKNTLVGRVISMLDYIMKGYLNGGVFKEDFIDQWHQHSDQDPASSLKEMIDFTEHCNTHLTDQDKEYSSLRMRLKAKLKGKSGGEAGILSNFSGFSNSFRIIAKLKSIQKEGHLFLIDSDFDVLYTINPSPQYKEALELHIRKHGGTPLSYLAMLESYQEMCVLIHDHMVKMPICRKYFSMLAVINFFSAYFSTLKKHHKVPDLPAFEPVNTKGCPALFPHLPLQTIFKEKLKARPSDILTKLIEKPSSILNECFHKVLNESKIPKKPSKLLNTVEKSKLLDEFKNEFRENIRNLSSSTFRRNMNKASPLQQKVEKIIAVLAPEFLKIFLAYFDDRIDFEFWNHSLVIFFRNKNTDQDFIKKFCNKFTSKMNTDEMKIDDVQYMETAVKSECSSDEIALGKRVVGGCGMRLSRQVAISSEKVAAIWQSHFAELLSLKYESFAKIDLKGTDKDKKVVFRLKLKDISKESDGDYSWMESLLVTPEAKDLEQTRLVINAAMDGKKRNEFKNLIENLSLKQLSQMKDRYQRTLLHKAATLEDPFYMETLLKKGLSQDDTDIHGYKPIHYAAMNGAMSQLECLLSKNLNSKSYDGSTPLIVAIQHNRLEVVIRLLKAGAKYTTTTVGFNPLHCALHQRNLKMINLLLDHIKDSAKLLNELAEEEGTPLMLACELDSVELIENLISMGANPAATRKDGMTAIEIAIKQGSKKILACLLSHTQPSDQAIETAVKRSSLEIVELLIKRPSFYTHTNGYGDTALHSAIRFGNIANALAIIESSPNVQYLNKTNSKDETAIDFAASLGLWNVVAKLISKDVTKMDFSNIGKAGYHPILEEILKKSPFSQEMLKKYLLIAAQAGNHEAITKILIPKGAKIDDLKGPNGWGILHYLAKCNGLFLFRKQIAKTGDLLSPLTQEGNKTLPYLAAEYGSKDVLRFLLEQMVKKNTPLDNHYNDRHLFYAVMEAGDIKQIQMMLDIFKNKKLENLILDKEGTCPAHLAAKIGSKATFKLLSNYKIDLTIKDKNGFTPLDYAVRVQSEEAIRFLLEGNHGVTVTEKALLIAASQKNGNILELLAKYDPAEANSNRALRLAIEAHDMKAFLSLLKVTNASLDSVSPKGWTPLLLASKTGEPEILSFILKRTTSLDKRSVGSNNPLHLASTNGHAHCVKLLMEAGFDPLENNSQGQNSFDLAPKDNKGVLAMLKKDPAYAQKIEKFQKALEIDFFQKALEIGLFDDLNLDLFANNSYAQNFLNLVLFGSFDELEKEIKDIKKIASFLEARDKGIATLTNAINGLPLNESISTFSNGRLVSGTPLHLLLHLGKDKKAKSIVFQFLKDKKLKCLRDSDGNTLAHLLVLAEIPEFIPFNEKPFYNPFDPSFNLKQGLYEAEEKERKNYQFPLSNDGLKATNNEGQTILHLAAKNNSLTQLKKLVTITAEDINLVDNEGSTALFYAIGHNKEENVKFLLSQGANLRHCDHQLITPLTFACSLQMIPIVKILLQNGADANQCASITRTLPLHLSLLLKNDEIVRSLFLHGVDCNKVTSNGIHAVHLAAEKGNRDILRLFAAKGISLDVKDFEGKQAIDAAASKGETETVATLLPDDDFETDEGVVSPLDSALQSAARKGHLETMQYLLDRHANPETKTSSGKDTLTLAAISSPKSTLESLFNYQISQNFDSLRSAICQAIINDNIDAMIALYEKGITPNQDVDEGYTGLHLACEFGALQCTQWFLKKGADPLHLCRKNKNALELAASNNSYEQFSLLLDYTGVDLDLRNSGGEALLHLAAKAGKLAHVLILIRKGASIDCTDSAGRTPLHIAAKDGHVELVNMLLICGANAAAETTDGRVPLEMVSGQDKKTKEAFQKFGRNLRKTQPSETCLHSAIRNQNPLAVSFLVQISDVNQQDDSGIAPLHLAVQTGQMNCIIHLLHAGASVDIQNKLGRTPLWYACMESQDLKITEALIHAGADPKIKDGSGKSLEQYLNELSSNKTKELIAILNL